MPFLFKIIAILIGVFIWKTVMASFAKARKAMRDEDNPANEPDTCDGENGPAPQATLFRNGQWKLAAQQLACAFDPGKRNDGRDVSISGNVSGHAVTVKRFGHNYVRYFVAFRRPLRSATWSRSQNAFWTAIRSFPRRCSSPPVNRISSARRIPKRISTVS